MDSLPILFDIDQCEIQDVLSHEIKPPMGFDFKSSGKAYHLNITKSRMALPNPKFLHRVLS